MGNSQKPLEGRLDELVEGLDANQMGRSGTQIFEEMKQGIKQEQIAVFNEIRLQALLKKYQQGSPYHEKIVCAIKKMNSEAQELFEMKWPTIKQS